MQNELYHHGVKGMKWGHRKTYNQARKDARLAYRKKTSKAFDDYEKSIADIEKPYKRGQNLSKKDQAREAAAEKKYRDAETKAKADYDKTIAKAKADYKKAKEKGNTYVNEYLKERNRQKKHLATKHAIDAGTAFVNRYLSAHQVTLNGRPVRINSSIPAMAKLALDRKYAKDTFK